MIRLKGSRSVNNGTGREREARRDWGGTARDGPPRGIPSPGKERIVNATLSRPPHQRAAARKPLTAVHVIGVFSEGVTAHDLLYGSAILEVTDADGRQPEAFYWATTVLTSGCHIVALDLQKFGRKYGEDQHRVSLEPVSCDRAPAGPVTASACSIPASR
jgi:hypothetical protein